MVARSRTPSLLGPLMLKLPVPSSDVLPARSRVEAKSSVRVLRGEDGAEKLGLGVRLCPSLRVHSGPCSASLGLSAQGALPQPNPPVCTGAGALSSCVSVAQGRGASAPGTRIPWGYSGATPYRTRLSLSPQRQGLGPSASPCGGKCRLCCVPGFVPLQTV